MPRSSDVLRNRLSLAPLFGGALLLSSLAACSTDEVPGRDVEPSEPAADAPGVQAQVDVLLLTAGELDSALAVAGVEDEALARRAARVAELLGQLSVAAEDARLAAGSAQQRTAVQELSRRTGQLAPELRKLKRALSDVSLSAAHRAEVLAAIGKVRVAAAQLDQRAGQLQAAAAPGRELRNGALYPGSSYWVLDQGHVDPIDAAFEDDSLELSIHDESVDPDVERDHEHTILVVKAAAKVQVPDARFAFIGPVGRTFWLLPEAQLDAEAAGILWPGLAAEEIEPGVFVDDHVEFRFKQLHGPNGLSLFANPSDESSPPEVLVDSENGLPDTMTIPVGSHRHVNWAFEAAGVYLLHVDVRGRLDVPGAPWITSSTELLKIVVLP